MLVVVPGEEFLTKGAAVLNTAESIGETGPVLQSAKLAFRVRVVVGNVGSAVRLGNAKVVQQKRNVFGAHHFPPVSMNGERSNRYFVFLDGFLNSI